MSLDIPSTSAAHPDPELLAFKTLIARRETELGRPLSDIEVRAEAVRFQGTAGLSSVAEEQRGFTLDNVVSPGYRSPFEPGAIPPLPPGLILKLRAAIVFCGGTFGVVDIVKGNPILGGAEIVFFSSIAIFWRPFLRLLKAWAEGKGATR